MHQFLVIAYFLLFNFKEWGLNLFDLTHFVNIIVWLSLTLCLFRKVRCKLSAQKLQNESMIMMIVITHKAPNTTIAKFAKTVDPDETAHNEPSHPDLQCLPFSL